MGVKLQDLIIRKPVEFQELEGKVIAIDAPNIIMGLFNFKRKNPDGSYAGLILDRTQRPISHLYGILYRINFYYNKKIFPIFCFDGRDSELKKIITKDQLNDFQFTQRWYEEAIKSGDRNAAKNIALSKEYLWQNIIFESKQLLGALGVPYIDSPASAESQCAYLVKQGIAHYSNSQDFDSLLFGCPRVIQNLSKSMRRKVQGKWKYEKIKPHSINLRKSLKELKINRFQLVDLGILIGTDYYSGINGIGSKIALKYIREYKQLEKIIPKLTEKYETKDLTSEIIKSVRKIFLFPEVNTSTNDFYWNFPNQSRVIDLLCKDHYLNKERVYTNLQKFISNYQKCRDYFLKMQEKPSSIQLTLDEIL
jgi:flap endonuclease-1